MEQSVRQMPLTDRHAALGGVPVPVGDPLVPVGFPLHYGDPEGEYRAVRERTGLLDLSYRDLLEVRGKDRLTFLHGMCTNDLKTLPEEKSCRAFFCTAKGRVLALAAIYHLPGRLLLDLPPGIAAGLVETLEKLHIMEEVEFLPLTESHGLLSLQGSESEMVIGNLLGARIPEGKDAIEIAWEGEPLLLFRHSRTGESGVDLLSPSFLVPRLWDRLAAVGRPVGFQALQILRVEAGFPWYGADITEETLAPEVGLDDAISYTKGCYVGQEPIVMIKHRGHVNKRLAGLAWDAVLPSLPPTGTKLSPSSDEPREAGFTTSAVHSPRLRRSIALGYVRREYLTSGTSLICQGVPVQVVEFPFQL